MKKGVDYQVCPGCGLRAQLHDGCNSLRCPTAACGVEFCFLCGEQAPHFGSGHWAPGRPCPMYNQPGARNAVYLPPLLPVPPRLPGNGRRVQRVDVNAIRARIEEIHADLAENGLDLRPLGDVEQDQEVDGDDIRAQVDEIRADMAEFEVLPRPFGNAGWAREVHVAAIEARIDMAHVELANHGGFLAAERAHLQARIAEREARLEEPGARRQAVIQAHRADRQDQRRVIAAAAAAQHADANVDAGEAAHREELEVPLEAVGAILQAPDNFQAQDDALVLAAFHAHLPNREDRQRVIDAVMEARREAEEELQQNQADAERRAREREEWRARFDQPNFARRRVPLDQPARQAAVARAGIAAGEDAAGDALDARLVERRARHAAERIAFHERHGTFEERQARREAARQAMIAARPADLAVREAQRAAVMEQQRAYEARLAAEDAAAQPVARREDRNTNNDPSVYAVIGIGLGVAAVFGVLGGWELARAALALLLVVLGMYL